MEKQVFKGRVTGKKLIDWINSEFKRLGIKEFEVFKIQSTRYSYDLLAAGAASLNILFRHVEDQNIWGCFYSFYSMQQLEMYLKNGYELDIKRDHLCSISQYELELIK